MQASLNAKVAAAKAMGYRLEVHAIGALSPGTPNQHASLSLGTFV